MPFQNSTGHPERSEGSMDRLKELYDFAASAENSRIVAEIWGDFVGWEGRRKGENGFLVRTLREHGVVTVFDVALGDGVDTIYLLEQGFNVFCNEVDDAFRVKAVDNAKRRGVDIAPTALDWRDLYSRYQKESFDAVLCMGNSLTVLRGRENQLKALGQFHRLLKPGGVLVIDERNYQLIFDNLEAVLAGQLHSSGKYVYTGTGKIEVQIMGFNEDGWIVQYHHLASGKKAYFTGRPFRKGELLGMLREAGFSQISQFSDYALGDNPQAEYYQYVCIR